jgi:hypothetical protein
LLLPSCSTAATALLVNVLRFCNCFVAGHASNTQVNQVCRSRSQVKEALQIKRVVVVVVMEVVVVVVLLLMLPPPPLFLSFCRHRLQPIKDRHCQW